MTADRQMIAARLATGLEDPNSIDALSPDHVNAVLKRLGIDRRAAIDRARKLAGQLETPAVRLLERIDEADDVAAEIDALEHARIDSVRTRLPEGVLASVAARAEIYDGGESNVTSIRRSSRTIFGWGGSLIGIAACLVLFIVIRPDQLNYAEPRHLEEQDGNAVRLDAADAPATKAETVEGSPDALKDEGSLPTPDDTALAADPLTRVATAFRQDAPAELSTSAPDLSMGLPSVAELRRNIAKALDQDEAGAIEAESPSGAEPGNEAASAAPPPPIVAEQPAMAESAPKAAGSRAETAADIMVSMLPATTDLPDELVAVLMVESVRAPAELRARSRSLPSGDLADRVAEARQLAGDNEIVGLISFMRGDQEIDGIVVLSGSGTSTALNSRTQSAAAFAERRTPDTLPSSPGFEIIELPPDRP
ncbi:MAG: hypothetical protein ACR2Q4_04560 [Geminicoccaceae bacterium]